MIRPSGLKLRFGCAHAANLVSSALYSLSSNLLESSQPLGSMLLLYHAKQDANQTLIPNNPVIMTIWIIRVVGMISQRPITVVLDL
jgi:hypothetical protein